MDTTLLVLLVAAVTALVTLALVRRALRHRAAAPQASLEAMREEVRLLGERLSAQTASLTTRLEGIDTRMTHSQSASTDLARGIFDALGDVRRATATVAEQARQFNALQDLLRAPKARGGFGEAMLEELLRQVLPPAAFSMQHRFSSGEIVDAVVRIGGRLACIDSKFPLSNYRRMCDAADGAGRKEAERAFAADVERHIRDISARYIVPDEGTLDFSVMYVPAEGVYGEILRLSYRKRPLFETAIEARVVPMSPLTMYAYLQTVLYGLRCLKIERSAERILDFCGRLQREIELFAADYDTLGRHVCNARAKHEEGARRLDRFRERLQRAAEFSDEPAGGPPLEAVGD